MAKLVKCPYCEKKLPKDEAVTHSKRYYHQNCFDEMQRNKEDRKELIEYICNLYNLDAPTGLILKQVKDFQETYNYKFKGIMLALQYFHDTLDNPVREGDGIGIVPYVYEDAKRHYITRVNVENSLENIEGDFIKKKMIKVKSPELEHHKKLQAIDISSL
jgi:molybdopterin converting factor small subunit